MTIAAIIADEAAIGMINRKTTAVRIIPAPGTKVGDMVEFGHVLPEPGREREWFEALPRELRERLADLGTAMRS